MIPRGWLLALAVAATGCFDAALPAVDGAAPPDLGADDLGHEDRPTAADAAELPDVPPPDAPTSDAPTSDASLVDAPAVDAPLTDLPVADAGVRCAVSPDTCPPERHCDPASGACVDGCRADEGCAATPRADGGTSPGRCDPTRHVCLDCEGDDDCAVRSVCRMGRCEPGCNERRGCAPGEVCCTGSCVDVQADIGNCGACARRCAAPNGVPACAAGVCGIEACTAGFADCNRSLADGCEADLQRDPARCGSCTVSCPTPAGAGSVACAAG
ncbi:MAG: hypothetical protein JWM10_3552, partial [Myxococcaceae bacterium]|nr:hypothetical protein [Myxococcaceae bacterium]